MSSIKSKKGQMAVEVCSEQIIKINSAVEKLSLWNKDLAEELLRSEKMVSEQISDNQKLHNINGDLKNSIEELRGKVAFLNSKREDLVSTVKLKDKELQEAKEKCSKYFSYNSELKTIIDKSTERINQLKARLDSLDEEKINLEECIKNYKEKFKAQEMKISELMTYKNRFDNTIQLNKELSQAVQENKFLKEKFSSVCASANKLSANLRSESEKASFFKELSEELEKEKLSLEEGISREKNFKLSVEKELDKVQNLYESSQKTYETKLSSAEKKNKDLESFLARSESEYKAQIQVLKDRLATQEQWINLEKKKVEKFWDNPEKELNKHIDRLNEIVNQKTNRETKLEQLLQEKENKFFKACSEIESLKKEKVVLEYESSSAREIISKLEDEITLTKTKYEELSKSHALMLDKNSELKFKFKSLEQENSLILSKKETEITLLNRKIKELKDDLELEAQKFIEKEQNNPLKDDLLSLKAKHKQAVERIEVLEKENRNLSLEINSVSSEKKYLIENKEYQLSVLKERVSELAKSLDLEKRGSKESLEEQLSKEAAKYEEKIASLQAKIEDLKTFNQKEIALLKESFSSQKKILDEAHQKDVSQFRADINNLKLSYAEKINKEKNYFNTRLETLNKALKAEEENTKQLQQQLLKAKKKIAKSKDNDQSANNVVQANRIKQKPYLKDLSVEGE